MFRSSHWTVSLLTLLLPGLLLVGAAPERGLAPAAAMGPAEPKVFPHDKHVSTLWLDRNTEEVPRDCRGCHDFDASDGIIAVSDTCERCHYPFPDGTKSLALAGSYDDRDEPGATFQHADHLDQACRDCHTPPKVRPNSVPAGMYMPEGLGLCVGCHDRSPKNQKATAAVRSPEGQRAFQTKINAAPRMQRNTDAVFRHGDHMLPQHLNDAGRCNDCHRSMARSTPDIGSELYDPASCGACHQDQQKGPLVFGFEARRFPSGADRSFYHSDHVTEEAAKKSEDLRKDSCLACHDQHGEEGRGVSDYPLKKDFDKYDACAACHTRSGLTREGAEVAWKIDDHGDVARKNDCGSCHLLDQPIAWKTGRARRESERSHPVVFDLKLQKHPHIVGAPDGKPADCAACHLSQMEVAPSRIVRRPFDHASHLRAEPSLKECLDCHTMPAEKEAGAFMEQPAADGRRVSYAEKVCASCHLGVERVAPTEWRSDEKATILAFDHADHVARADGKGLDCSRCHVPAERDGGDYAYVEGVQDCSACHDHEKHPETTGKKNRAYTNGCVLCHEAHEPGMPPVETQLWASRGDIRTVEGAQFHPLPAERACADCHGEWAEQKDMKPRSSQLLKSDRNGYEPGGFHGRGKQQGLDTPAYCWTCHFHNPLRAEGTGPTQVLIGGRLEPIPPRSPWGDKNNEPAIRKKLGTEMKGYPGLQK